MNLLWEIAYRFTGTWLEHLLYRRSPSYYAFWHERDRAR